MATFAQDIGYSDRGVVPDAGNLAHAIASEGAAKGAANASLINYFGNQAIEGYAGKLEGDVVRARNDALSKLDTGDFIGPTAWDTLNKTGGQLTEVKDDAVATVFDRSMTGAKDSVVQGFEERISNIQAAGEQGVISQDEARQRITAALKKAIAAMPGRADSFRKAAGADWDRMEWMDALTKQTAYEREAAAGAKAADDFFKETVKYHVSNTGLPPDVVANILRSDPSAFNDAASAAVMAARLQQEVEAAQAGQTIQNITSSQYTDAVAREFESGVTMDVVGVPLVMSNLMEEAGIDLNSLMKDGAYDYNKEREYGITLAGVRTRLRSMYEGKKNAALLKLDSNADPRMMNADKVKLREGIEKRYNDVMDSIETNPNYIMQMFKAVQQGQQEHITALSAAANLTNSLLKIPGSDRVIAAYMNNPVAFAKNHPVLSKSIEDGLARGQALSSMLNLHISAAKVVDEDVTGNEFTSKENFTARGYMAIAGVDLFHSTAIGTTPIEPEHISTLAETLTFSLGVDTKIATDVSSLISSGVMKAAIDRMSDDQKETLLTTMNNTWQNITLNTKKHFGPVTTIRESFTKPVFVAEGNVEAIRDEVTGDRLQLTSEAGEFRLGYKKGVGGTGKRVTSMVTPVQTLIRNIAIKASVTSLITGENEAALKNTYTQEAWDSLRGVQATEESTTTPATPTAPAGNATSILESLRSLTDD